MGKLLDRLNQQLTTKYKKDAEDCLKIYNCLKNSTGYVWESNWRVLVKTEFNIPIDKRIFKRIFKPTNIGYILLKGLDK